MPRIIVDCHNDLVQILSKRGTLRERASLKQRFLPELVAGGIGVQVVPVSAESSNPESTLRESLQQIAELYRQLDEVEGSVQLCLTGGEVHEAVSSGRIAFVLALEGASMLGNEPSLVAVFHRLGCAWSPSRISGAAGSATAPPRTRPEAA